MVAGRFDYDESPIVLCCYARKYCPLICTNIPRVIMRCWYIPDYVLHEDVPPHVGESCT